MNIGQWLSRGLEKMTSTTKLSTYIATLLMTALFASGTAQAQDGVLRVGYRTDAAPFSFRDDAGNPAGYSVELCERVVQDMQARGRLTVEFKALTPMQRGDALLNGEVDLLCEADSVTLDRRESFSFSLPIFVGGLGAALRNDAPSRLKALMEGEEPQYRPRWRASFAQILKQRTFVVVDESLAEDWLAESIDEFDIIADTVVVADYEAGMAAIMGRKADVFFADRAILLDAAKQGPDANRIHVVGRRFTDEPLALAVRRGDDALRLSVDRTLSRLYRSGEIYEIYEKFFGEASEETRLIFRLSSLPE